MIDDPVEPFERVSLDRGETVLWVRRRLLETLLAAGFRHPARLLRDRGEAAPGRGPIAIVPLAGGGEAVLKQYRRGGIIAAALPDRFVGGARFRRELEVGATAHRRGIPVPEPLAIIRQGRGGLFRVYGVTRRIPAAGNLLDRIDFGDRRPVDAEWIGAAAAAVRRSHDTGLRHADLSLGNFLISRIEADDRVFLVDLAGAWLGPPLTNRQRRRSLRRLRRSWVKQCELRGRNPGSETARFLARYCDGDPALRREIRRCGGWTRMVLGIHRIGWRLTGATRRSAFR
jgi:3-deoxy-D-manno-octulosonic acid kinase